MTENAEDTKVTSQTEQTIDKDGNTITTKRKSIMQINPDGSTTITDSLISSTVKNEIKLDANTKVNVSEVDAELDDKKYIEALRSKDILAVLKDANQMICLIPLSAGENILKKMGSSLQKDFSLFSFGIYSLEEINEIRKTSTIEKPQKPPNYTKDFLVYIPPVYRLGRNKKYLNSIVFKKIQERLDFLKAEEERKKREEEERKRKEEEKKRQEEEMKRKLAEEKAKRKEKACNKLKQIRESNRLEILKIKFAQYRKNCEDSKLYEQTRKTETEKKVLRLKIKRDAKGDGIEAGEGEGEGDGAGAGVGAVAGGENNEEEQKKLEEEKLKQEEEVKKKKEEEDKLKQAEEEKKKQEEEENERKRLELLRIQKEEEEKKKKEEEEAKKKQEEEENERKRLELLRIQKEEEEKKKKEEEEAKKKQEEEENQKKAELLKLQKEEEEKKKQEEEEAKKKQEEEENQKKAQLLKLQKEEEEKKKQEEEEAKKKQEEEENQKKAELLKLQKEEEEKKKKEEEEENERRRVEQLNLQKEKDENKDQEEEALNKNENTSGERLRGANKKSSSNTNANKDNANDGVNYANEDNNDESSQPKEETAGEQNEDEQKPKKKKVLKKVKKIVKVPKKKKEPTYENKKPFYISGGGVGGGVGDYHDNVTYTGKIPLQNLNRKNDELNNLNRKNDELNNLNNNNYQNMNLNKKPNSNPNDEIYLAKNNDRITNPSRSAILNNKNNNNNLYSNYNNLATNYNSGNNNNTMKSYEYYQNNDDDKYDPINTKEFFEMNRNRYLSELWRKENEDLPKGKKGIKSRSIGKIKKKKDLNADKDKDKDNNNNNYNTNKANINTIANPDNNNNGNNEENDGNNLLLNLNDINNDEKVEQRKIKRCRNRSTDTVHQPEAYSIKGNTILKDNRNLKTINNNNLNSKNKNNLDGNNYYDIKEVECPRCSDTYVISPNKRFYYCNDCQNLMCGKCSKGHYLQHPDHKCSKADLEKPETREYILGLSGPNKNNLNDLNNDPNRRKMNVNVNKYINKNNNLVNIHASDPNSISQMEDNNRGRLRNKPNDNENLNKNSSYNIPDNAQMNAGTFNAGVVDDYNCNYCGKTQKNNPNNNFYICRDCDNLLCNQCKGKHEPKHNLLALYNSGEKGKINSNVDPKLIYQYYKNNSNENIPSDNNYNNNDNRNNNINDNNRGWLRNKPNDNKNINKNITYNSPDNQNKVGEFNTGSLDNDNCNYCGKNQRNNPNERFYICRDCNNNLLCNKCKDDHEPKHNMLALYNSGEMDKNNSNIDPKLIYQYYKNNSNENIPSNLNNNKNITNASYNSNDNLNNNAQLYNNNVNNKEWLRNKPIDNSQMKSVESNPRILNNDCYMCGINQKDYPYERFNLCRNCNYLLCNQCKDTHYNKYPKHFILSLYNSANDEPRRKGSQSSIHNSPSKNRNRNNIDNVDNYQTQYQMNKNKNNVDNISNLNSIDVQNNKNKFDNNLNQKDLINTNNSYSTKETNIDNRNLSPSKRIALRKYNNRYNDQDEDNYNNIGANQDSQNRNNNQNLRNNNNNLAKSRKCKIEFDLNKEDSEFNKCEIFGFPACFNCLKSKKNEKTIQIFYCSQCMKLFCRDCLYLHNYCS